MEQPRLSQPTMTWKPSVSPSSDAKENKVLVSTWLSLEPGGQMLINLNFEKSITNGKQFRGPLGRHGAIRQKKEEVFEKHGHQFVQNNFIISCPVPFVESFTLHGLSMSRL